VLVEETPAVGLSWSYVRHSHKHAGSQLWNDYLSKLEVEYGSCPKHGEGYRGLRRSVALEGFAELIERHDAVRLAILLSIPSEN
jgi:hypothetical protein